jgi:very-short-patch-repair endonuclease
MGQSAIEKDFWETAKPLIPELQQEIWIDKYRVDFLIPSKKIIIELYGYAYHNTKQKITKDAERERHLQKLGYTIIRFTGSEIYKDVDKCVRDVLDLAQIKPNKIINIIPPPIIKSNKRIAKKNSKEFTQIQKIIILTMSIISLCSAYGAIKFIGLILTK